ncbi:tether containing UBX domain for GLUT4 isoform X2 [Petromyzon marinus]|uniref:tether containing UBX domain for GLUT4 isoform X2 n=1 Tax=Petromyzon marinus TaxID=7757 RepID=UPI003F6EEE10
MAASVTVSVLAPNGRRQNVRIGASTLLMQVLEEVCKKQNFSADDYDLKFQRSILDLSMQGRFANLPNNAKLEMVPSSRQRSSVEAQVRIALQAPDGTRMQHGFMTSATLWDVVTNFPQSRLVAEQQGEGSTPACVYTHDEYVGEEVLKKTTLKSLGITGGSAIIRFLVKRELTPSSRGGRPSDGEGPSQLPADPGDPGDLQPEPRGGGSPRPGTSTRKNNNVGDDDDNDDDGKRTPVAPFVPFGGGGQRLGGSDGGAAAGGGGGGGGVAATAAQHRVVPSTSASAQGRAATGPTQAKKYRVDRGEQQEVETVQPAGLSQASQDFSSEELARPCERQVLVFNPSLDASHAGSSGGAATGDELPDEFFEVTVDDVRRRLEQLKRERIKMEEAPLTTQALRESQELEKMKRYPQVVIRVQFPDRNILQGVFRPNEPVCALVELVRSCLEEPAPPFYLYTAPPKRVLDASTQTLFKANLFPTSLVHFGCTVKRDHYLKLAILEATEPQVHADAILCSVLPKTPVPGAAASATTLYPIPDSCEACDDDPDSEPVAGPSHEASKPTATVPKWLKLPGKR